MSIFLKRFALGFSATVLAAASWAAPAKAEFEFLEAHYYLRSFQVVCEGCNVHKAEGKYFPSIDTPNVDVDYQNFYRYIGDLVVTERDSRTFDLRNTTLENIVLKVKATGVILDASYGHNVSMSLSGLAGHALTDIFNGTFTGGKFRLNVFGNVSYMRASNNGMVLSDSEQFLTTGVAFDAYRIDAKFTTDAGVPIIRRVNPNAPATTESTTVTLDDLKSEKLN